MAELKRPRYAKLKVLIKATISRHKQWLCFKNSRCSRSADLFKRPLSCFALNETSTSGWILWNDDCEVGAESSQTARGSELRLLRGCRSCSLLPAVQSCGGTALFSPAPRLMPPSAKTERWSYHLQSVSRWINQACNAPMLQQGHNKQFSKNCADIIRFFF